MAAPKLAKTAFFVFLHKLHAKLGADSKNSLMRIFPIDFIAQYDPVSPHVLCKIHTLPSAPILNVITASITPNYNVSNGSYRIIQMCIRDSV